MFQTLDTQMRRTFEAGARNGNEMCRLTVLFDDRLRHLNSRAAVRKQAQAMLDDLNYLCEESDWEVENWIEEMLHAQEDGDANAERMYRMWHQIAIKRNSRLVRYRHRCAIVLDRASRPTRRGVESV